MNYTRNGGFLVDANRYVVDAQGSHLQVFPVDGSGTVVATGVDAALSLRLPETSGTCRCRPRRSTMTLNLNANSALPTTATFDRFDPSSYNQSAQTTVYDAAGNAMTLTNYFKRTSAPTTDQRRTAPGKSTASSATRS